LLPHSEVEFDIVGTSVRIRKKGRRMFPRRENGRAAAWQRQSPLHHGGNHGDDARRVVSTLVDSNMLIDVLSLHEE
jgi:hypothetical protein